MIIQGGIVHVLTLCQLYERTLKIESYAVLEDVEDLDLSAEPGTIYELTESSTVTIIDPFVDYLDTLKKCFDFDALREFCKKPGFSLLFDGMHGAGGPFARRILLDELGLPEVSRAVNEFSPLTNGYQLSH